MYNTSYDSALEDFLLRFGDQNDNKAKVTSARTKQQSVNTLKTEGIKFSNPELKGDTEGLEKMTLQKKKKSFGDVDLYAGLATGAASSIARFQGLDSDSTQDDKNQAVMAGVKDGVGAAMPIAGMFKQVEEGGKAMGAMGGTEMGGFVSGALDPLTTIQSSDTKGIEKVMAIDPLASAMISMRNAKRNVIRKTKDQQDFNLKESALEKAKREEEYRMAEGLASLENLKGLRQKQLGIIS